MSSEQLKQQVETLAKKANELEINDTDLDEAVHDAFSQQASDVNNNGVTAQIKALLESGLTEQYIVDLMTEIRSEKK